MRVMMTIGDYILSVYQDTDYEQLVRTSHGGFSKVERGGQSPTSQQTGRALETIQLSGQILGNTGGGSLDRLRELQAQGIPHQVIKGDGTLLGLWKIEQITETQGRLIDDGTALKTRYSINLEQYL